MKGKYHTQDNHTFLWECRRRKDLEFRDEPSKRVYEFLVTCPDRPNWGFRDVWTRNHRGYEGTHNTYQTTKQREMANYVISNFVKL